MVRASCHQVFSTNSLFLCHYFCDYGRNIHNAIPELNECTSLKSFSGCISQHGFVGQYSNFTSSDAILSFVKKYRMLLWHVLLFPEEPLPFFSSNIFHCTIVTLIQYWVMNFLFLWLQKLPCPRIHLMHHILTTTSSLLVKFLALIRWCVDDL